MPLTVGMALSAAGGLGKTIFGLSDLSSAEQELERSKRPQKKLEQEWLNNESLTESRANQGMTDATKELYTTESQRGLAAGIGATLQGGGDINHLQTLFDGYNRGMSAEASKDADLQTQNIIHYMKAGTDKAGQEAINFGVNELQPYLDKQASLTSRKAAGITNAFGGISDMASAASSFGVSQQNKDLIDIAKHQTPAANLSNIVQQDPYPVGGNVALPSSYFTPDQIQQLMALVNKPQ